MSQNKKSPTYHFDELGRVTLTFRYQQRSSEMFVTFRSQNLMETKHFRQIPVGNIVKLLISCNEYKLD